MATGYILYNPHAGQCDWKENLDILQIILDGELQALDITRISNYAVFLRGLEPDDYLILCGGDGTLNRFVNDTGGIAIRQEIFYFPSGNSNDFAHDLGHRKDDDPFPIGAYLKALPRVTVRGKTYRFLNGVGYGIDGYCCQEGDRLQTKPGSQVNYTSIAATGLLLHYKPTAATVTVDGQVRTYQNVWLAPTMFGKFYGGGMTPAPDQDRTAPDRTLSVMVLHDAGKLRTLCMFPEIFKGAHVRHTKYVDILTGHEITVEFDRPTPLQIDGETILGVSSYTARA